jgi:hypothetical protein
LVADRSNNGRCQSDAMNRSFDAVRLIDQRHWQPSSHGLSSFCTTFEIPSSIVILKYSNNAATHPMHLQCLNARVAQRESECILAAADGHGSLEDIIYYDGGTKSENCVAQQARILQNLRWPKPDGGLSASLHPGHEAACISRMNLYCLVLGVQLRFPLARQVMSSEGGQVECCSGVRGRDKDR